MILVFKFQFININIHQCQMITQIFYHLLYFINFLHFIINQLILHLYFMILFIKDDDYI